MADNMKIVTKEYVDAIETDIQNSRVGQKALNGGEIFNDYDTNKALSTHSATFGSNNISGCLAFKMTDYSYNESDNTTTIILGECPEENLNKLAVGDIISCKIVYSFDFVAKIKTIDVANKTIIVDNYITNSPLDSTSKTPGKDNGLLWIPNKPDAGYIELELTAFTTGSNNINNGDGSLVGGINNKVSGDYSIVGGANNEATEGALVAGTGNKVKRDNSAAVGGINLVEKSYSFASGYHNQVYTNTSRASGQQNRIGYADSSKNTVPWYGSAADGTGNGVYAPFSYASGKSNQIFGEGSTAHGFNNCLYSMRSLGVGTYNYIGTLAFKVSELSINEDKTELTLTLETINNTFNKITTSMTACIRLGEVEVINIGSVLSTDATSKIVKTKISVNIPDDLALAAKDNYFWVSTKETIGDTYITTNTFASGMYNRITGNYSSVNGCSNRVSGSYSGAFGKGNKIGQLGFIEGLNNNAEASYNIHVEGDSNQASTNNVTVHVEGKGNQISNSEITHVEGSGNIANTNNVIVHAEGKGNQILNSETTHVEGSGNIVLRSKNSHVSGYSNKLEDGEGTILLGEHLSYKGSVVEGAQTQRLIIGKYNTGAANNNKDLFFLIGDGTGKGSSLEHDAFCIFKSTAGDYTIKLGDVSVKASNLDHCNIPVLADTWDPNTIVQRTNTGAIRAKNTADSDSDNTVATKGYLLGKVSTLQNGITANENLIQKEINADRVNINQLTNLMYTVLRNVGESATITTVNRPNIRAGYSVVEGVEYISVTGSSKSRIGYVNVSEGDVIFIQSLTPIISFVAPPSVGWYLTDSCDGLTTSGNTNIKIIQKADSSPGTRYSNVAIVVPAGANYLVFGYKNDTIPQIKILKTTLGNNIVKKTDIVTIDTGSAGPTISTGDDDEYSQVTGDISR